MLVKTERRDEQPPSREVSWSPAARQEQWIIKGVLRSTANVDLLCTSRYFPRARSSCSAQMKSKRNHQRSNRFLTLPSLYSPPPLSFPNQHVHTWIFASITCATPERHRCCSLTCILAGFHFVVGLVLHRPLILSHLLHTQACGGRRGQCGRTIRLINNGICAVNGSKRTAELLRGASSWISPHFRLTVPFV